MTYLLSLLNISLIRDIIPYVKRLPTMIPSITIKRSMTLSVFVIKTCPGFRRGKLREVFAYLSSHKVSMPSKYATTSVDKYQTSNFVGFLLKKKLYGSFSSFMENLLQFIHLFGAKDSTPTLSGNTSSTSIQLTTS